MNEPPYLPSVEGLKTQAKRLRCELEVDGKPIGHSRSLELLARQHGFKDWNTLHASAANRPSPGPVTLGQRVSGHYLGQYFEGHIVGIEILTPPDRFRISIHFDNPVDVITFEGMSNFRQRVSCVIGRDGSTAAKTSDGRAQLALQM